MPSDANDHEEHIHTFQRSLKKLRGTYGEGQPLDVEVVKVTFLGFVLKLQKRYPFTFAKAYRNLPSEVNRQIQERFAMHFLFGAVSELSHLPAELRDKVWLLGGSLSRQIGHGGEHFCPQEFNPDERQLAHDIGLRNFEKLLHHAEELSLAMKFKFGPVNSAEHVAAWCFRYVAQFLKAAKWESAEHGLS